MSGLFDHKVPGDERSDRRHRPTLSDEHLAKFLGAVDNLNDTMGQIHVGLKTLRGVQLLGAEPRQLSGVSQRISRSPGKIAGYSIRETTGAVPATVRFHDGEDLNGDLCGVLQLAAGESVNPWFMPGGVSFGVGLYVEVLAGTIEGAIYLGTTL